MFGDRTESESQTTRAKPERERGRPLLAALLALASVAAVLALVRRRRATPKLEPPF